MSLRIDFGVRYNNDSIAACHSTLRFSDEELTDPAVVGQKLLDDIARFRPQVTRGATENQVLENELYLHDPAKQDLGSTTRVI